MDRIDVFEFEDATWFPSWLRTSMTNMIAVVSRVFGVTPVLAQLTSRVLREHNIDRIVDLGTGAGGVMPDVLKLLRAQPETAETRLLMTDRYPNSDALEVFNDPQCDYIRYESESVDATDFASAPSGLKTMVNCFHHMGPAKARSILKSAQKNCEPLLIYEMGENLGSFMLWLVFLPISLPILFLMCCLLTPFARPLSIRQFAFTYLIPVIPLFFAWDGQATMPRLYTFADYDELLRGLDSANYRWEKGHGMKPNGKKLGTFLLGLPVQANS